MLPSPKSRNTRQTHSVQPLMRFRFPFSVSKLCCAVVRQPASGRSRFDVEPADGTAGGRLPASRFRPCGFPPCVNSCATRVAGNHASHRFGRVIRRGLSFARRSATRKPNLHTTGPDLHCAIGWTASWIRQHSWDSCTLRSFPRARVRAFVNRFSVYACATLRRSSPHAVFQCIPHR